MLLLYCCKRLQLPSLLIPLCRLLIACKHGGAATHKWLARRCWWALGWKLTDTARDWQALLVGTGPSRIVCSADGSENQ